MVQVKSFSDLQEDKDFAVVNAWLTSMEGKIEVIDIKYGVGCYPPDKDAGWSTQYVSGVLIVYKEVK